MEEWLHDKVDIKEFIRKGFDGIYTSFLLSSSRVPPDCTQWQVRLSKEDKASISGEASGEEIKSAFWSLKAFKAPRPNGLHTGFLQRFWMIVGGSLVEEVKMIFANGKMPDYMNRTHITIIPRMQGSKVLGNYRPISLCTQLIIL